MSQADRILNHLKKRPLTAIQALSYFGTFRLAARIADLRAKGHMIETEMVERNGKRVARYRLAEK
jgi:hypothetical protein